MTGRWAIIALFVATPTAAFAAAPSLLPDRAADKVDAVPMMTVLDPSGPTVEVKVTNSTGKEVTLHGWLNGEPATAPVAVRSEIVKLAFPAMSEGTATLKLSLTAEGIADVAEHKVLVSRGTVDAAAAPKPSWSKDPKPKPSWSKSPKPSMSPTHSMTPSASASELPKTGDSVSSYVALGGGSLALGLVGVGLAWAMGRRASRAKQA